MNKPTKKNQPAFSKLLKALNEEGYFVNTSDAYPKRIYVISHNPKHDTLAGVWNVINANRIVEVSVQRCSTDERVTQIQF